MFRNLCFHASVTENRDVPKDNICRNNISTGSLRVSKTNFREPPRWWWWALPGALSAPLNARLAMFDLILWLGKSMTGVLSRPADLHVYVHNIFLTDSWSFFSSLLPRLFTRGRGRISRGPWFQIRSRLNLFQAFGRTWGFSVSEGGRRGDSVIRLDASWTTVHVIYYALLHRSLGWNCRCFERNLEMKKRMKLWNARSIFFKNNLGTIRLEGSVRESFMHPIKF